MYIYVSICIYILRINIYVCVCICIHIKKYISPRNLADLCFWASTLQDLASGFYELHPDPGGDDVV